MSNHHKAERKASGETRNGVTETSQGTRIEGPGSRAGCPAVARGRRCPHIASSLMAVVAVVALGLVGASSAFANAPNPTSVVVEKEVVEGNKITVTISGTWTWNVPNGAQKDCNDQRIGVGYAIDWGDNQANPLKQQGKEPIVYVGDATDDWVHSVTAGKQIVDGPFKPKPHTVEEEMGPEGLPVGVTKPPQNAVPTKAQAEHWVSNCGPTAQSKVNGQLVGNSEPSNPTNGFPSGTFGPISHTYTTPGPFKICPVFYDPHGHQVGEAAGSEKEITAGGKNYNGDNSVESNGNLHVCELTGVLPKLTTKAEPAEAKTGQSLGDKATIEGNNPQGSITWKLYGPFKSSSDIKESSCTGSPLFTSSAVTVNGNGSYNSPTTTASEPGFYQWVASFESSEPSKNFSVGPVGCGTTVEQVNIPKITTFTVKKEQRLKGQTPYTTATLKGEVGQTVEYLITVENTGNTTLKFSALKDAKCTNIKPSGETELKANESETFTCEHVLVEADKPTYTNVASIKTGEQEKLSNEVTVEISEPPIVKEQRLKGQSAYTTSKLVGDVGETVEYKITVTNGTDITVKYGPLKDGKCTNINPSGETELKAGESETFTCEHVLAKGDESPYANTASIEANGKTKTSNTVEVGFEGQFTIVKEQRIQGEDDYTASLLKGKVGETVEYLITVENIGNTTVKFSALKDAKCTNISPSTSSELKSGEKETFTCEHVLAVGDENPYKNAASIEGGTETKTSNTVEVEFEPEFTIVKEQRLKGEAGYTKSLLKGNVGETVEYKITVENTGNTTLSFGALKDAKCSTIVPSTPTELKPSEKETFTCEHVLKVGDENPYKNVASIEAGGTEQTSNTVEVEFEPQFKVVKEQRLKGEAGYTKSKLTGKVGETVEYKITVENTGNTTVKFGPLSDPKCTNILPSGATELAPGKSESFTCEHVLKVGDENPYVNVATIEGSGKTEKSNEVEVGFAGEFTIVKEQRLKGEAGYTKSLLKGNVGETVEYKITVENTGNTTLSFGALKDAKCSTIVPSTPTELKPSEKETFTCEHVLKVGDENPYKNVASIEAGGTEQTSNTVEVEFEPQFKVVKEQRLKGEAGYTKSKLTGKVGETVEYKITVENTGNTTVKFGPLSDPKCTNILPSGATELAPGKSESFTCEHVLKVGDENPYVNVATIEGSGKTEKSNEVEVGFAGEFTIVKEQRLKGEAGYTKSLLKGNVGETVEYKITVENTGNTTLSFGALKDAKCSTIVPSTPTELKPSEKETFTCEHVLKVGDENPYKNVASIEAGGTEQTSNTVEVEFEPQFKVVKEQRLKGEAGYTKSKLTGKVGETVEYKITVENTGNTTVKFGPLSDPKCTNILPSGATELAPGKSESFTCEHVLKVGDENPYVNVATIEGSGKTEKSNEVEVGFAGEFTIVKEQRLKGEAGYTKSLLKGNVGETVEYKITVENTGNTTLSFGALKDAKCSTIVPSTPTELKPSEKETFTCEHVLKVGDENPYKNVASIEAGGTEQTSNTVEVEFEPQFKVVKEQRLKGEAGYTKSKLTGKVGETVEYKITVENTGNTTVKFGPLSDPKCTNILPSGATELAPGKSESFTCEHVLKVGDENPYVNVATIEGSGKTEKSNEVEVGFAGEFTIVKEQRLKGEAGYTKSLLKGNVGETVEYKITVENTGNTTLSFGALKDAKCSTIVPSTPTELKPSEKETFTCEHVLKVGDENPYKNVASIEAGGTEQTSNTVEVEFEPQFKVVKEQRLKGEAGYTKSKLTGKVGETVEYKITVENTGNTTVKFGPLSDPKCTNILPSGATELAPGKSESFTCEHVLKVGDENPYVNVATIEGSGKTEKSNEVEVGFAGEFTIVKEQRLKGEAGYTKSLLKGNVGETVEYKITVENTGNTTLSFGALKDAKCSTIVPSTPTELKPSEKETFTCEHVLKVGDENPYKNVASIEAGGTEQTSNTVEVEFEPQFKVVKEQRLKGEAGYTKSKLTGKVGETVEYKITVENTGNTTVKFGPLSDPKCTNILPSGATELAPGKSESFTCEHVLKVGDENPYVNVATIEGSGKTEKSNEVEVGFAGEFTIVKEQRLKGEAGYTKSKLVGRVGETVDYKITVTDTGNATIKFSAIKDAKCTNLSPSAPFELKSGESASFTCEHVLAKSDENPYKNVAAVEGGGTEQKSNEVEVEIEPEFTVVKEQRLNGEANYTKAVLKAKVGETVEYKLTVTNTGAGSIKFGAIKDPNCTNIQPAPAAFELKSGESKSYTCEHLLSKNDPNPYVNVATIEGGGKEKPSEKVEVEVEPEFTVVKEQRLKGQANYTKAVLKAKVGETVEYKLTVTNTGAGSIKFGAIKDPNCTNIQPAPAAFELKSGESKSYTCEHLLSKNDPNPYVNVATIEGGGKEKPSEKVEVEIEPEFTVVKEQRLKGQANYTKAVLKAKVGETVEYKLTVTNTGAGSIKFGAIKDPNCTNIQPAPAAFELKSGESKSYTCEHLLSKNDPNPYVNVATIEGGGKEKPSEKVEVEIEPEFTVVKEQRLKGQANYTKAVLKAKVGETVEYKLTVTNTGAGSIKFGAIKDPNCTNIQPAPAAFELKSGESKSYTCEHLLSKNDPNPYVNVATIEGGGKEKPSEKVEVEIEPEFTVVKEQRLKGQANYTKAVLKAKVGETVEYKLTVTNTGAGSIKFGAIKDPNCTNIQPAPAAFELKSGESKSYTCEHLLSKNDPNPYVNVATIEGGGKEKPSEKVEVEIEPEFTVVKEQRIKNVPPQEFTTKPLTSELGKEIEYKIIVTNEGSTTIKFSALKDPKCQKIEPLGTTELAPGKSETFLCEHVLVKGDENPYKNTASIIGGTTEKTSNTVEVKLAEAPKAAFTIIKEQEIQGSGKGFTTGTLVGKLGAKILYQLIVKNTGNVTLTFSKFTDTKCEGIVEGTKVLAPGASTTYTCFHVINEVGDWINFGTITGTPEGGTSITHTSNQVIVYDPSFTIEKLQKLPTENVFTPFEVFGKVGETVQYEIIVRNTSSVPVTFSNFVDTNCSNVAGGPGANPVPPGEVTVYTCEHTLATIGEWANEAAVEGDQEAGRKTSNRVVAQVSAQASEPPKQAVAAQCGISEASIKLKGAAGAHRAPFKVKLSSLGIKEITFYVDGHKLKKLKSAQAKNGFFVVKIDPRKYHFGAHTVSVKALMSNGLCAKFSRSGVFVRAKPAVIKPKFAG